MSQWSPSSPLCRQTDCLRPAGRSGYCPHHLERLLRSRSLDDLVSLLEEVVEQALGPHPAGAERSRPLLN